MRAPIAVIGSLLVFASIAIAADWPQWRGPHRDGISPDHGLLSSWSEKGPDLVWSSKTVNKGKNIGAGWSSVSLVGDRIYTMGDFGKECHVVCLERGTGKLVWSTHIGRTRGNGGPRCTPTIDGENVYALTNDGQLACLGTVKGEIRWKHDYAEDFAGKSMANWHFCESPLVDGEKLICTPGGDKAGVMALDKKTGKVIWQCPIPGSGGAGYSSLVASDGAGVRQYITFMGRGKGLVGVEAKSGKLLWSYTRVANGTGNIPTAIIKGDLVFATSGYGTGSALLKLVADGKGGVTAQEQYFLKGNVLQNHHGQVVLVGDYVYGGHGHNEGHPFCLHMESGKFAWGPVFGEKHPGSGSAAVIYADGNLYFRWQDNTMGLIEASPGGYVLRSSFSLPSGLNTGWPQPVVVDGKLYIRGNDNLLCYDVRAR